VLFESDRNALLLTEEVWSAARASLPAGYASDVLREHADALLLKLESSKTIRGRIESLLLPILHTSEASVDTIAGTLGISRQTLFRRLKAEGTTFEMVLGQLRHTMALYYLGEKNLSVNETGYLVGFSDPAAFSRAFKRWTGSSPGRMREDTR
jgi:AraC-like DNA-binding protein